MTSRHWCITINNPSVCPLPEPPSQVKLLVYQLEEGEEGTPHIQGYMEFVSPVRMRAVKRIYPTAHIERRRGTKLQALRYVSKEDTRVEGPWIHPEEPSLEEVLQGLQMEESTGKSGKLSAIKSMLDEGYSEETIADEDFNSWVRHYRAFREYKLLKTKPRSLSDPCNVIVVQGPTGTGKSKYCLDSFTGAYWKQRSNWWDGYSGQEVIILDEFYGWIPYDLLLRLCDRYPLILETKGGQVQCLANTVVITTNSLPHEWYKKVYFKSFVRRVTEWKVFPIWGVQSTYTTYESFIENAVNNNPNDTI